MREILIGLTLAAVVPTGIAAPESYTLDPYHTFVHFGVDHNGFSTIWGRFDRSTGKFTFDRESGKLALEVNVETASVTTGDSARGNRPRSRDEHLRSPDFFNTAEFPRMVYKATNARLNGGVPVEIQGELMLLGVTRPMNLTVDRWKCASHPVTKRFICGGNAIGGLKRSEFGMKWGIPATGDDVKVIVTFEALKD